MSVHTFTLSDPRTVGPIVLACFDAGRSPDALAFDGTTLTLTFLPDLTAGETAVLNEVVRAASSLLTRAERNAIESDVALLRAYQGITSPTLAQTAAATKSQSRILRAILRD